MHDVTALRTEGIEDLVQQYPEVKAQVDSGRQGLARDCPDQGVARPHYHPESIFLGKGGTMKLAVIGLVVVVVGVGSAAVNFWARQAFPDQWGGPNIGGGFLLLISVALTLAGLVFALTGLVNGLRQRARRAR